MATAKSSASKARTAKKAVPTAAKAPDSAKAPGSARAPKALRAARAPKQARKGKDGTAEGDALAVLPGPRAIRARGNTLVVVESPTKATTIKKYLGAGYTGKASVGHIMDLPKSK